MENYKKIKNIVFDFGGVIVTLDHEGAVEKFARLGLENASERLNPYTQGGIFGQLEEGIINAEEFVEKLSDICGKKLTHEQCLDAWLTYRKDVPKRNLDMLRQLREEGHRLILLSNTNPFMMEWAGSGEFDGMGHSVFHYFDSAYLSYKMGVMKPDPMIFRHILIEEQILPEDTLFIDDGPRNVAAASQLGINTFCPKNGSDWTKIIHQHLRAGAYVPSMALGYWAGV